MKKKKESKFLSLVLFAAIESILQLGKMMFQGLKIKNDS
jgi:hypothetical protein